MTSSGQKKSFIRGLLTDAVDEWKLRLSEVNDPFETLGNKGTKQRETARVRSIRLTPNERRALAVLDANPDWEKSRIHKQYGILVKCLHPDLNGGDRFGENRLTEVVWAWDQIKDSRNFDD